MGKISIVIKRERRRAYFAEPVENDTLLRVFDSEDKAIKHICDLIKYDHEYVDGQIAIGNTYYFKGDSSNRLPEGWFNCSYGLDGSTYHKSIYYMYKTYDVE